MTTASSRGSMTAFYSAILLGHLILLYRLVRHQRDVPKLSAVSPSALVGTNRQPKLSVIVAARNEEGGLRAALRSMLHQDYPNLELIVVDDRSTDATGRIIADVQAKDQERVRAITVTKLRPGWLGKNHALWLGAQQAVGDWLLFTDADMIFDRTAFRRAITYSESSNLDHLTLLPGVVARDYWLRAFVSFVLYAFLTSQRPYLAGVPQSKVGIGIGAFNLFRRAAYDVVGTYAAVSLRPDDDMRLGLRVKQLGLRQRMLSGSNLSRVEWYPSLQSAINGFEKNQFANLNYSLLGVVGRVGVLCALTVFPYLAIWRTSGLDRRLLLSALGIHSVNYTYANWQEGENVVPYIAALPVTALLAAYAVTRSAWVTVICGGIRWRDTFYPLAQVRSQTGLEKLPSGPSGVNCRVEALELDARCIRH